MAYESQLGFCRHLRAGQKGKGFMSVSLHLKAKLEMVQNCLEPLLLSDSSAVLVPRLEWVSVYAEQLSDDIGDIEELALPLSEMSEVIAVVEERVYRFVKGALQNLEQTPNELPKEALADFSTIQALAQAGLLPIGTMTLENEAEKPSLAEFFGRSQDE